MLREKMIKLGKEYTWEMSHRLPFHNGWCRNIHGHSYKMRVELIGELDENGMLIDFYDIDKIVRPVIEIYDHSMLVDKNDYKTIKFLEENGFRHVVIDFTSTSENIAINFAKIFSEQFRHYKNLKELTVRIYETSDAFAEYTMKLNS